MHATLVLGKLSMASALHAHGSVDLGQCMVCHVDLRMYNVPTHGPAVLAHYSPSPAVLAHYSPESHCRAGAGTDEPLCIFS